MCTGEIQCSAFNMLTLFYHSFGVGETRTIPSVLFWQLYCIEYLNLYNGLICPDAYFLTELLNHLFNHSLHGAWSRVLLEKLKGSQLVKEFPAFYGTRKFNDTFTTAHHLSLS
jgi:hypothetical protein